MSGYSATEKAREAKAYRLYAATKPKDLTPPRTFVATSTQGNYTGPRITSNRPGADDHLSIHSKGYV